MKRQLLTIIKLEAYFQRYTNQFWAGRQWSCSVISSIPVLWGQEFTLPPANEPQCWENTIHMHIPENTEEMDAFLFSTLPMKTKVTGEMSLQASKLVKGLVWLLFAGNCMDFWQKLLPIEHAEAQNIISKGHYWYKGIWCQKWLRWSLAFIAITMANKCLKEPQERQALQGALLLSCHPRTAANPSLQVPVIFTNGVK